MSTRSRAAGLVGALIVAASGACTAAPAPAPATTTLDAARDGDAVTIAPGDKLIVRLESNASTGYSWSWAEPSSDVLKLDGPPTYEPGDDSGGRVGVPGTQVFSLTGVAPGTRTLRFAYTGPSRAAEPPARTVTYSVTVTAPR